MSSKGLHEIEMGTEYIHFHKANDDRSMGLFFKCGGGEGGKVTLWWGRRTRVWSCSDFAQSKSNADFRTTDPSKLIAAISISGWKKLRYLLCFLHSLRTVGHTYGA
jgi:hypothetical protein